MVVGPFKFCQIQKSFWVLLNQPQADAWQVPIFFSKKNEILEHPSVHHQCTFFAFLSYRQCSHFLKIKLYLWRHPFANRTYVIGSKLTWIQKLITPHERAQQIGSHNTWSKDRWTRTRVDARDASASKRDNLCCHFINDFSCAISALQLNYLILQPAYHHQVIITIQSVIILLTKSDHEKYVTTLNGKDDEWFDPGDKLSAMCHRRHGLFFGCKVILGADYHTKVYNCAHFWTPGYFRPRIMVEMATTERIGALGIPRC